MVRSNSVSGVPALLESLDSRQLFSTLPTVGADPTFAANGHLAATFYGHEEAANAVVTLNDGRALVGGYAVDGQQRNRTVFALFKTDGTLDPSFDGDGKLALSVGLGRKLGGVIDLQLAKDGGVLVVGYAAAARFSAAGTLDASFGDGGFAPLPVVGADVVQLRDGHLRAAGVDGKKNLLRVTDYTAGGDAVTARHVKIDADPVDLLVTTTAEVLAYRDGTVRSFKPDLSKDKAFGTNGTANVTAAFNRWAKANGPWASYGSGPGTGSRTPDDFHLGGLRPAKDGYVVTGRTATVSERVETSNNKYETFTVIYAYVGEAGPRVTIDGGSPDGKRLKAAAFDPPMSSDTYFSGTFTLPGGRRVFYEPLPNDPSGLARAIDAAPAGDGKYYVVGQSFDPSATDDDVERPMGFYVTRSAVIA